MSKEKVSLVSAGKFSYDKVNLSPGDEFEALPLHAKILVSSGKAVLSGDGSKKVPDAALGEYGKRDLRVSEEFTKGKKTRKKKGTYNRRDLQAE